jgi:GT2 family glycosyltransferase
MNFISVIIISYNRVSDTLDLLTDITQLKNINLLKDVIILNNASTDNYSSIEYFVKTNNQIPFKYVNAPENLGVSRGRNYATKFAKGDIFFYVDDDVNLTDKETLPKIIKSFSGINNEARQVGVVSYKVYYASTMEMQVNAFPHKKFRKYKDKHQFLTYYYTGCAHAKLRQAWNDTGEYPNDFFYGMEEYDFSYRVLNKGYCIKYDDSVTILHKESALGRTPKAEKLRMMWVNKTKVAWRYLPKKYFYTTAILWSLLFIRKSNFNWSTFVKGWKDIFNIKRTEKRTPINNEALEYLRETEARLWY